MPPKTELLRAAEILQMCLDLAVASPEQGIGSTAAIAMLEALSSVHEAGRSPDPNATEELANFTRRTGALASSMAKAALAKLQVGDSSFVSGAVEGKGTNLQLVSSLASALTESGLQVQRLYMPPGVLTTSRRLQASACSDVGISAIYWQRSNPYTWASSSKGVNQYVSADATVAVLEFEMCGSPLMFNESIPDRTMRLRQETLRSVFFSSFFSDQNRQNKHFFVFLIIFSDQKQRVTWTMEVFSVLETVGGFCWPWPSGLSLCQQELLHRLAFDGRSIVQSVLEIRGPSRTKQIRYPVEDSSRAPKTTVFYRLLPGPRSGVHARFRGTWQGEEL